MEIDKIKPIPKYIQAKIQKCDKASYPEPTGYTRYYAYLTKNAGELVKVTVAVRHQYKHWYCKQVAVHGVHSDKCFVKDLVLNCMHNYITGWFAEGLQRIPKWFESDDWGWHYDKLFDPFATIVNMDFVTKFPAYKYSAIELYNGVKVLQYLRLYEQYPQVEYLMKLGLQTLVFSKMILRRVGKDKQFCKWLIRNREELISEYHYIDVILRAYRTGKPLAMLQAYSVAKKRLRADSRLSPLHILFKGETERFFAYIAAQNTNAHTYLDYLNACNYLELDMSLPKNRYPHDFRRWHDIRIDEYATAKALQDEKERQALYARFAEIAEKYLPLQYGKNRSFVCVIARSPDDLIREGERLHHCVGRMNYDQRFIREESLIFFVREAAKPDVPLVTVEYSLAQRRVLQCYGDKDSKPNDAVLHYVHKVWLPYANRMVKQLTADRAA